MHEQYLTGQQSGKDRYQVAEVLGEECLRPEVDIDWQAPLAEDKPYIPFHRCSLYGTALWERLDEQQQIELTKHEFASIASNGLWLEVLLMQILLKELYDSDPRATIRSMH